MKRWIAALLCVALALSLLPAMAESQALPLQECHRVTLTKKDTTQKNGSVIRVWTADTALDSVDAELKAITDGMAERIGPTLPKAANKTSGNSRVDIEVRYSRTGLTWMSFLVHARIIYHRGLVGQEIVSRTWNMTTGERVLLTDIFPDDSEAWLHLSEAVESRCREVWPEEEPDAAALEEITSREGLEKLDFTLHGMSLVLHVPTARVYPGHAEKDATLIEVTLMYPDIREYMTADAWRETDNLTYYKTAAITFDDGPVRTNTTNVLQNMMEVGCRGTFFVIGNRIKDYRDLVQRESDEGHAIGYHNWNHNNISKTAASTLQGFRPKCDSALLTAVGFTAKYDRVPYGLWPNMVKAKVGWPYIQWSMDTYDWRGRSTSVIMKAIRKHISDGDVILMHDIKDNTPNSCKAVCSYLMEEGYMMLTIDELFAKDGVELQPDTVYYRCVDGDTTIKKE